MRAKTMLSLRLRVGTLEIDDTPIPNIAKAVFQLDNNYIILHEHYYIIIMLHQLAVALLPFFSRVDESSVCLYLSIQHFDTL